MRCKTEALIPTLFFCYFALKLHVEDKSINVIKLKKTNIFFLPCTLWLLYTCGIWALIRDLLLNDKKTTSHLHTIYIVEKKNKIWGKTHKQNL